MPSCSGTSISIATAPSGSSPRASVTRAWMRPSSRSARRSVRKHAGGIPAAGRAESATGTHPSRLAQPRPPRARRATPRSQKSVLTQVPSTLIHSSFPGLILQPLVFPEANPAAPRKLCVHERHRSSASRSFGDSRGPGRMPGRAIGNPPVAMATQEPRVMAPGTLGKLCAGLRPQPSAMSGEKTRSSLPHYPCCPFARWGRRVGCDGPIRDALRLVL
jgi:hypothetical protein